MPYAAATYNKDVGPAKDCIPVTASDTADVFGNTVVTDAAKNFANRACRGLLCAAATTAKLTMSTGQIRSSVPLQAGYNPMEVIQVWSTGTSPTTGIFALT